MAWSGSNLESRSGKEIQLWWTAPRVAGIAMIPGTDLCQVVENTRNDIRLLNAAVRRLGDHPYRTTALCTDRNIDTEQPFQSLLPRACYHAPVPRSLPRSAPQASYRYSRLA